MANEKAPAAEAADEEKVVSEVEIKEEEKPEGEELEGEDADEGDEPVEGDDGEKKLSKTARKNARIRARIADLETIARRESERADREAAARKVLTDDMGPPPKREDFTDSEEFVAELAAYKAEARSIARLKKSGDASVTEARQSADASQQILFRERVLALADRYPDIEERIFNNANPVTPAMAAVMQASERGAEVAYHLATHREKAQRIAKMSPELAAYEIGQIAATLDAPKPRTATNAPPPPTTVRGGKTLVAKDPDKMSSAEWLVWRNAQLKRK